LEKDKPWISEEDRNKLVKMIDDLEAWVAKKVEEQKSKLGHEEPAFTSEDVVEKLKPLAKYVCYFSFLIERFWFLIPALLGQVLE
jgi:hypothetical protein